MAEDLAEKLRAVVGDEGMKAKAVDVASQMRAEPGVSAAVDLVEKFLREQPEPNAPAEAKHCPDGAYAVCNPQGHSVGKIHYRNGFGFAPGVPAPVTIMRLGKFFTPLEGEEGWRSYDVQIGNFLEERMDRARFSSNGRTIVLDTGWQLHAPARWSCTVS